MSKPSDTNGCRQAEQLFAFALQALPPHDAVAMEAHIDACPDCREELETLQPIVDSFASWPTDVLRPSTPLWGRLAERIGVEAGKEPEAPAPPVWQEPDWEEVAPGISCKVLATDQEQDRVSMLVRLEPGAAYPPHRHRGIEELHLLEGELFIEDRKLVPGDYNFGEAGTSDTIVRTDTGCTCVLITSPHDVLQ